MSKRHKIPAKYGTYEYKGIRIIYNIISQFIIELVKNLARDLLQLRL